MLTNAESNQNIDRVFEQKLIFVNRIPDCFKKPKWLLTTNKAAEILKPFLTRCKAFMFGGGNYNELTEDIDIVIFGLPSEEVPYLICHIQNYLQGQDGKPHEPYNKKTGYTATILQSSWQNNNIDWNILPAHETMFSHAASLDVALGACYFDLSQFFNQPDNQAEFDLNHLNPWKIISPYPAALTALDTKEVFTIAPAETLFRKDLSVLFRIIKLLAKNPAFYIKNILETGDVKYSINAAIDKLFSTPIDEKNNNINLFADTNSIKPNRLHHEISLLWCSGYAAKSISILQKYSLLDKIFPVLSQLTPEKREFIDYLIGSLAESQDENPKDKLNSSAAILYCAVHWYELYLDQLTGSQATDTAKIFFQSRYKDTTSIRHRQSEFLTNISADIETVQRLRKQYTASLVVPAQEALREEDKISETETVPCEDNSSSQTIQDNSMVKDKDLVPNNSYLIEFPALPTRQPMKDKGALLPSMNKADFKPKNMPIKTDVTNTCTIKTPTLSINKMPTNGMIKPRRSKHEKNKDKKAYRDSIKNRTLAASLNDVSNITAPQSMETLQSANSIEKDIIPTEQPLETSDSPTDVTQIGSWDIITPLKTDATSFKKQTPLKKSISARSLDQDLQSSFEDQYTAIQQAVANTQTFSVLIMTGDPIPKTFPDNFKSGYIFSLQITLNSPDYFKVYSFNKERQSLQPLQKYLFTNEYLDSLPRMPEIAEIPYEDIKQIIPDCIYGVNPKYQILENLCTATIDKLENIQQNKSKYKKLSVETKRKLNLFLAKAYYHRGNAICILSGHDQEACEGDYNQSAILAPWLPDRDLAFWAIRRVEMVYNLNILNDFLPKFDYNDIFKEYAQNQESAVNFYKKALALDPHHVDIPAGIAEMERIQNQYDELMQNKFLWLKNAMAFQHVGKTQWEKKEWLSSAEAYHNITQLVAEEPYVNTINNFHLAAHQELAKIYAILLDQFISQSQPDPKNAPHINQLFSSYYSSMQYFTDHTSALTGSTDIMFAMNIRWGDTAKLYGDDKTAKLKYEAAAKSYQENHQPLRACECFDLINQLTNVPEAEKLKTVAEGYKCNRQYTKAIKFYTLINQLPTTTEQDKRKNNVIISTLNNINKREETLKKTAPLTELMQSGLTTFSTNSNSNPSAPNVGWAKEPAATCPPVARSSL